MTPRTSDANAAEQEDRESRDQGRLDNKSPHLTVHVGRVARSMKEMEMEEQQQRTPWISRMNKYPNGVKDEDEIQLPSWDNGVPNPGLAMWQGPASTLTLASRLRQIRTLRTINPRILKFDFPMSWKYKSFSRMPTTTSRASKNLPQSISGSKRGKPLHRF
jgi:hypothetical protein